LISTNKASAMRGEEIVLKMKDPPAEAFGGG
jgi:hypothetical protein